MITAAIILMLAFAMDTVLGDPPYRYHPVRLIGSAIALLEAKLLRRGLTGMAGGLLVVAITLALASGSYLVVRLLLSRLHPGFGLAWDLYVTYSCLALGDLSKHAQPVAAALAAGDLSRARAALQRIVGRNAALLDKAGVARAAVETLAENFVDGVLSPLFWYGAGVLFCASLGCPSPVPVAVCAVVFFKAASTLDSMVGYRHGHYLRFGKAAARLDDFLNFLPARLSLGILYLAALLGREHAGAGWQIARRDRRRHLSPNAGHPESFVAGALGISLGGPTLYPEGKTDKPWLGDGSPEAEPQHIRRCCHLVQRSGWLACFLILAIILGLGVFSRG